MPGDDRREEREMTVLSETKNQKPCQQEDGPAKQIERCQNLKDEAAGEKRVAERDRREEGRKKRTRW